MKKISLVTSTMNRPRQIAELLQSIEQQQVPPYEIVIVDQSEDDATAEAVRAFADRLPVVYFKDNRRGLSRGRNLGLQHITGDIVAFPDDDCLYSPETLARVERAFSDDPGLGIYTGMSITPAGVPSQGRWGSVPHTIDRYNIWTSQTSYTTFYSTSVIATLGGFDESLGVGSGTKWGAGEETELMLRALRNGARGLYDPALKIMHPEPLAVFDAAALDRGRRYNRGFGRVMRIENYPLRFVAYMAARPLAGIVPALLKGRRGHAKYRYIAFSERLRGWLDD